MKVLSIDVGIKNLAMCLFNITSESCYSIDLWCVSNLCGDKKISCDMCDKSAKYLYNIGYYCKKHVKSSGHDIIPPELEINKLKKNKIADLKTILKNNNIPYPDYRYGKLGLSDPKGKKLGATHLDQFADASLQHAYKVFTKDIIKAFAICRIQINRL